MKLGSCTQSGHGLALGGRHFKNNKTSKKKKSKDNPPSTDLHYSKCHPEPHPFIFKMKKNYKNSKHKGSQITAYIQKIYKFIIFRLLPQTTAHLSLRNTTCLNQSSLQETTGHGFTKSRKTAPNWNHLFSLNYATTIRLGISTLKPLKPTKSFSSLPCPQRIRGISFNKLRRMTNGFDYS